MAWNSQPRDFQWAATLGISSVMSRKVNPSKPPVWVERKAVGSGQHWMPMADRMGMATVREHRPKPDMSWMAATRGVSMIGSSFPGTGGPQSCTLLYRRFAYCSRGGNVLY